MNQILKPIRVSIKMSDINLISKNVLDQKTILINNIERIILIHPRFGSMQTIIISAIKFDNCKFGIIYNHLFDHPLFNKLQNVTFKNCEIIRFQGDVFKYDNIITNLSIIQCTKINNINSLSTQLTQLTNLTVSGISLDKITRLPPHTKNLTLTQNKINSFDEQLFSQSPHIETIDFSKNELTSTKLLELGNALRLNILNKLKILTLSDNTHINTIHSNTLSNINVNIINLKGCGITTILTNAFNNIPLLTHLYLDNNPLLSIKENGINNCPMLEHINLKVTNSFKHSRYNSTNINTITIDQQPSQPFIYTHLLKFNPIRQNIVLNNIN
jgi:Leucine-rich repeat (LRR) protein